MHGETNIKFIVMRIFECKKAEVAKGWGISPVNFIPPVLHYNEK
jgi:hypothetical protein